MTTRLALDEEQQQFVEVLDAMTRERIVPCAEAMDAEGRLPDPLVRLLVEQELHLAAVPEDLGGGGGDLTTGLIAVERVAAGSAATAMIVALGQAGAAALVHGGGDGRAALAALEGALPVLVDAGDVRATTGEQGCVLDGDVDFADGADLAGALVVVTRDDGDPAAAHAVAPGASGLRLTPAPKRTGLRGTAAASVSFHRTPTLQPPLPPAAATAGVQHLQLALAALGIGLGRAALRMAVSHLQEREQFGRRLIEFRALRDMIGRRDAQLAAAASLLLDVAGRPEALTAEGRRSCAWVVDVATGAVVDTAIDAVQLHGGYGYVREYPVERAMRDAASIRARTGGARVHREAAAAGLIARSAL
ncbi:MAG TPA: acyl-CoA dehydrogenase family protein [Solirubrobacteraceae bacterium]|nr:acyl-CoA dehydrogenase family protein [Solirubrobacteraceae bacterium]